MILVLQPSYHYVRINRRGTIFLKNRWWNIKGEKWEFFEYCYTILSPLISTFKYVTKDMSYSYYLGMQRYVQNRSTPGIIDFLYCEFIQQKPAPEIIEIEVHFEKILKEEAQIKLIRMNEYPKPNIRMVVLKLAESKTLKLILAIIAFATAFAG